jgi:hypothetical protein
MEPATIIVTALALGAATGLKSVSEKAVKDSYEAIKALIGSKYPKVGIKQLEEKPDSKNRQGVVEEYIVDLGVDKDEEILQKAKTLLQAIEELPQEKLPAIGVNLEDIKAAALKIEDVIATGTGVNVKKGEFQGDIEIKNIRAGSEPEKDPNS